MKNTKSTVLILLALVLVLGGAYLLYTRLSAGVDSGQLQAEGQPASGTAEDESAETTPETPNEEPAQPEENTSADTSTEENASAESDNSATVPEEPQEEDASQEENAPVPASDFLFYDRDGNEAQLSDYFGKPIVLNFWASWCGPCKSEMPGFEAKYQALGGDVQFLMVNVTDGFQETQDSASSFIDEAGYTFPVFYDLDSAGAMAYSVYGLPATYFISAEGNVIARASGAISEDLLQQGIDMIYTPA